MIHKIENIEDVTIFFSDLFNEGVSAHPDDDFTDYINYETKDPTYTATEAALRNELMNKSSKVCISNNIDIYELMLSVFNQYLRE